MLTYLGWGKLSKAQVLTVGFYNSDMEL